MAYLSKIDEITDHIVELLKTNAGELGLGFVGAYDEKRLPKYPAVVVSPGNRNKSFAGVGKFDVDFVIDIWVYHADMTVDHVTRNKEDLKLVNDIELVLEADYTLGERIVFGFVANEEPGMYQPRSSKSDLIVGTRMQWVGMSRRLMEV